MTTEKQLRINALAKKAKTPEGLTPEEKEEQRALREEYLAEYRAYFTGVLENTYLERQDGTKEKLHKKRPEGDA